MYSDILIDKVFKGYEMAEGEEMKNLSRINILIGKNNSGKSRFLRILFSKNEIKFRPLRFDLSKLNLMLNRVGVKARELDRMLHAQNYRNQLQQVSQLSALSYLEPIPKIVPWPSIA